MASVFCFFFFFCATMVCYWSLSKVGGTRMKAESDTEFTWDTHLTRNDSTFERDPQTTSIFETTTMQWLFLII